MVDYQTWIQVAYRVAQDRGFESATPSQGRLSSGGRGFGPGNSNAEAIQVFADIWQDRKQDLQNTDESGAREIARQEIQIGP